ncbi:ferritin-like domain-containing protein [Halocatena marina]|uniref:Ferritin-like domain-containing protein n=1 Tax=Halocatena marina TaxID=2934937 RepID=A0ABD5YJ95_9EURY|nr:ferritin-like domain-containing protein [Halocatena marina]
MSRKNADTTDNSSTEQSNRSRGSTTRRGVLTGVAALGSTALLGSASGGLISASDTTQSTPLADQLQLLDAAGVQQAKEMSDPTDVDILNYALALEHLEYAFYRDGLKEFGHDELMGASALESFSETVRMEVPAYLAEIRDNEKAHVDAIAQTVEKLDGTPATAAEYDFGYETPSEFLATGKALENTGVSAYAGAAPMIMSNKVLSAALSIHTVEARHASFLNLVNSTSPFPKAFDEAKSMEEVLKIAGQFITSTKEKQKKENAKQNSDSGKPERKQDDGTSDLDVLNYALTLEHLEYAFYRDGLKEFSDSELENAVLCRFGDGEVTDGLKSDLAEIRDHEKAHVDAITKTVKKLDGTPVEEAEYDFGYETASEFLGVAQALENTGVAAYLGAGPTVSNDTVFEAAASIQSVEARHAGFLNELNGDLPFPKGFDEAKSMKEVTKIAGQFIVSN